MEAAAGTCIQPDKGSVVLKFIAQGVTKQITLTEVYYASGITQNLISYGVLDGKGYTLGLRGNQRVLENKVTGNVVFDVELSKNVLFIQATACPRKNNCKEVIMAAVDHGHNNTEEQLEDSQKGTLMEFHKRLGHLNYDSVEKLAKDPGSGITIADRRREKFLICAQGKKSKKCQARVDSGQNSPIDRLEEWCVRI